jgi:hypothetical protein
MMFGSIPKEQRFWLLPIALGMVGLVAFSGMSIASRPGVEAFRVGDLVPAVPVSRLDGEELTLREAVEEVREVIVVSPTCGACARELADLVNRGETVTAANYKDPTKMLLLVVRTRGIPRAGFMDAYNRLQEMGAPVVLIQPPYTVPLGVRRVPYWVMLRADGKISRIISQDH